VTIRPEQIVAHLGLSNAECALIHSALRDRQSKLRLLIRNARDNDAEEHACRLEAELLLSFRVQAMIEHRNQDAPYHERPMKVVGQEY
jgi:hypothetical protein